MSTSPAGYRSERVRRQRGVERGPLSVPFTLYTEKFNDVRTEYYFIYLHVSYPIVGEAEYQNAKSLTVMCVIDITFILCTRSKSDHFDFNYV